MDSLVLQDVLEFISEQIENGAEPGPICCAFGGLPDFGPVTPSEQEILNYWLAHMAGPYFHGGAKGLGKGQFILPPSITGADPGGVGDRIMDRQEGAFFTPRLSLAKKYDEGQIYRVAPLGAIFGDVTYLRFMRLYQQLPPKHQKYGPIGDVRNAGFSFRCEKAEILEVLQ